MSVDTETAPLLQDASSSNSNRILAGEATVVDKDLEDGFSWVNVSKEINILFALSWPVTSGYFLQNSLGLVAVFSLGHLGTKELGASALANMFINVSGYAIGIGMATALDTLCSQSYTGSSDPFALGKHLQRSIVIMALLSIPIATLWFYAQELLILLGQDPQVSYMAALYARYNIFGLFPLLVYECIKRYLQSQGIMKANLQIILVVVPFNMLMQYVLVWSPFSIGYIGAPIAISLSYILMMLMGILYIAFIDGYEVWGGWDWKEALDWYKLMEFLSLGIPGVMMVSSEWWAFEICALCAGWIGEVSLAAQTIVLNTCSLTYMLPLGISVGCSARVGNALGSFFPNRARVTALSALILGLIVAILNSSALYFVRDYWGYVWNSDPAVAKVVAAVLPLAALFQISDGIGAIGGGILRGCGRQIIGAYANLVGYYIIGIPGGIVAAFTYNLGLPGLWSGLTVALMLVSFVQLFVIFRMDWVEESRRSMVLVAGSENGRVQVEEA
ncbi:hypothetical protein HK098_005872 [Nowakowskiella sp. JEL0407]|nr:hypothetical protein HK098_005872 [Nowakowskiella sp. JEL0407]